MLNDSRAAFPNRIRALVADSDERFLRSASLMLSLINFLVATCDSPAAAVKLLSGRLKDADVVFIDALRATTCGFDFRGIVETHLCIPVVYLFSFDYNVSGDVAEALRRNVFAATYVVKKPLDAEDHLCRLWRIIQWSQALLRRGQRTLSWLEWPRGNQALPAAVGALLAGSSTSFEDQGEEERVVREGRGRRRKLADSHDGAGSSSGYSRGRGRRRVAVGGRPTENVTQGQEGNDDDDVVPSHQQPGQQDRRGLQAMGVQNQQPVQFLFMQPVPQMLNLPRNNPMISTDAAGPSSSNVAPWAGASNTSASALLPLPMYHAPARANLLSHQQPPQQNRRGVLQAMDVQNQQHGRSLSVQPIPQMLNVPHINPMISMDTAGPSSSNATAFAGASNISTQALLPAYQAPAHTSQAPVPELPPQVYQQQQPMAAVDNFPRSHGNWTGPRRETGPIMFFFQQPPAADPFMHMAGGHTTFGASPACASEAGAHRDTAVAHLQSPSVGAQQQADRFDDVFRAMMEMNDTFPRSNYGNCSANGLLDPATNELAPMVGSGNCSHYGSSSMVTGVNGDNSRSFMAAQDLMVPTENQVELGAPDIYASPVESPGSSAMFNGNGEMTALFPSDQYDDNTMLSLDPLWDFDDDVPVHAEGHQQAATVDDSTNTTHATASMSNGGESGGLGPNGNMGASDDGLELLEEYLKDDNVSDFLHPQNKNNG